MHYQHKNCGGLIKSCPEHDESFCDHCGKWVNESDILETKASNIINICSKLEQGRSKMTQTNDDFELTDCSDPNCFICIQQGRGYPSSLNLNPYHIKQAANSMAIILNWIKGATR